MMKLSITGQVVAIHKNIYTSEKTNQEFKSWRVFLLNSDDNFSPTIACSVDFDEGLRLGFDNPINIDNFLNKNCILSTDKPQSYQGRIIPAFKTIAVLK